jgi:NAD+ synthase (glutamine-hydrolysing)
MAHVRVAACQVNTVVGDLDGNAACILDALATAERGGADLAVFPELAVTGYPPEDLLERPAFVVDNQRTFARIAAATGDCAAVVGFVGTDGSGRLTNSAALCAGGGVVAEYAKRLLPNYGVFDEQRWFAPGHGPAPRFLVAGVALGLTICEDMWFDQGPMFEQAAAGARILVNLNASPYSRGRRLERLSVLGERVAETGCAIIYVNQVGGQDELVFDGASMVIGRDGMLVAEAPQFEEVVLFCDLDVEDGVETDTAAGAAGDEGPLHVVSRTSRSLLTDAPPAGEVAAAAASTARLKVASGLAEQLSGCAEVYGALVLGTRDYLRKNGFSDAVLGLSGGIDSSLVATVAVDALGPEHVHGVTMPSRYSSEGSIADAMTLGANLGIEVTTVPIEPVHRAVAVSLSLLLGAEPTGLTDENLQSRIRGVLLMALSNARGWIVITTGNKSEMATGYSTLYGDSAGGFAVIKDVPKTLVYELCRFRNDRAGTALIPDAVLLKAPSAELRPDQRDEDSLPPYAELDPIVAGYVEGDRSAAELVAEGFDQITVARVIGLVDQAEYKRRQMPPGVRISAKAFGKDRRMPITNHYRGLIARPPDSTAPPGDSKEESEELEESEVRIADSKGSDHHPVGAIGVKGIKAAPSADDGEASAVV